MMGLSIVVTLLLFGYVVYSGVTAPDDGMAEAQVDRTEQLEEGLAVHVVVSNPTASGFRWVTVEVDCGTPAPQATVENMPGSSTRSVMVVCPADSGRPSVSVVASQRA